MTGDKRLSALPEDTVKGRGISGAYARRQWSSNLAAGGKTRNELNEVLGELQFQRQHTLLPL